MIRNSLDALNEIVEKLGVVTDADYIYTSKPFTGPVNVTRLFIQAWGAGGGGAASSVTISIHGGAGGYAEGWVTIIPGQTIACTVGIGGLGGVWTTAPGADGVAGGSTSVGSIVTVAGGSPGTAAGVPGAGGAGSAGLGLSVTGGSGFPGPAGSAGFPGVGFMMPINVGARTMGPTEARRLISCGGWGNQNASGTQGGDGLIIIRWYK